jgi:hypothetical protein
MEWRGANNLSIGGVVGGFVSVSIGLGGAAVIGTGVGSVIFGSYLFIWSKEANSQEVVDYFEMQAKKFIDDITIQFFN